MLTANTVLFLGSPSVSECLLNYVESRTEKLIEETKAHFQKAIDDMKEQFQNANRRRDGTVPKRE
jgi:hypothetical protein